jgi:tRNA A-37 threonylcarbamoyl transferase component Bud32
VLQARAGAQADREAWLVAVADEIRRMHDQGYYHRDLKVGNVLAELSAGRRAVIVIDLEGVVARSALTARERAIDLGRLWLSLEPWTTPEEREGLLERYRMTRPVLDVQALRPLIDQRVDDLRAR